MADEVTLEMEEIQNQPKKDMTELNKRVEHNLNNVESKLTAAKTEVTKFKTKVYSVMAEMDQINERLEYNSEKLQKLSEIQNNERPQYQLPDVDENDEYAVEEDSDIVK